MSNQGSVCRMIIDSGEVIANQVFSSIQSKLSENNVSQSEQQAILESIKASVSKNVDNLVDRVIKVVD